MRRFLDRTVTVALSAALVVLGLELTSYAANGHALLLGRSNHSVGTTTVTNDARGPAMTFQVRNKEAPLAVSGRGWVKYLNADTVDGLQGKSLQTNATRFTIPGGRRSTAST